MLPAVTLRSVILSDVDLGDGHVIRTCGTSPGVRGTLNSDWLTVPKEF